ncbi:MAG: MFS transporter [Nitrososphaerota archaeon]|nr:MFS transporter [Nitrososphaerota archaeon]
MKPNEDETPENDHSPAGVLPALLVMMLTRLSFGALAIIFPLYINTTGLATGVALALYPLLEAFSASPIGSYSDRVGRKYLFASGLISLAVLNFMMGLTRNYFVIAIIHSLMGISAAAVTVSTLALITDYTKTSNRGRWMGAFDMANLLGYALGFLLGSYFAVHFRSDLSLEFFVIAGTLGATSVVAMVFVRDVKMQRIGSFILNPFSGMSRSVSVLTPIWFALTTIIGVAFFLPKALNSGGVAQLSTGFLLTGVVAILGLGSVFWGVVSDHIGRMRTLLIGVVSMNIFLVYLLLIGTEPATLFSGPHIVVIGSLVILLSAVVPSLLAAVGDDARTSRRGSVMGLYGLLLSLGLAFGNLIAGLGFDWMNLEGLILLALIQLLVNEGLVITLMYLSGRGAKKPV